MTQRTTPGHDVPAVAAPVHRAIDRLQRADALGKLVGDAPAFREAVGRLSPIARADATVLLHGETGTGKELVARAIHYLSDRRAASFTAVNCGSLPDTLLEDEFFGHEPGAFTDARSQRTGLLRQANGGTLFLDEVDTLSPRAQVSLLRVLQDRTYRALGSSREQYTDMRVIAATNVELWPLVSQRAFRSDLFYRLSVLTLSLPPLRERVDDIIPLTPRPGKMRSARSAPGVSGTDTFRCYEPTVRRPTSTGISRRRRGPPPGWRWPTTSRNSGGMRPKENSCWRKRAPRAMKPSA
jgi:DNA-binding NtrC family response regulator